MSCTTPLQPFLKWVGGKRLQVKTLETYLPPQFNHYYEPFLGGGALFFHIQPKNASLSDINENLIGTYQAIKYHLSELLPKLQSHQEQHSKDYYYIQRERFHTEHDPISKAALFIYLNKTGYNGLYRVNKQGKFNVPVGSYAHPKIFDESHLKAIHNILQSVSLTAHSFEDTPIQKGAFYYLDPPYHQTFDGYSRHGFGEEQQRKLAAFCHTLHQVGAYFLMNNADTGLVRELYGRYKITKMEYRSMVGQKRQVKNKVLAWNY